MRPSCLALSLLVLFIFPSSVQGIRSGKSFKSAGYHKLHEGALMKNSNGVMGDVILCKQGHCTGNSRKLFTAIIPTSATTLKNEEANLTSKVKSGNQDNGGKKEKIPVGSPTSSSEHKEEEMDIAEMDYSPARRKPPIHN